MSSKDEPWNDPKILQREFVDNRKSTSALAKEWGTYPMTIRRALKKHGFKPRDKSQAQKNNIEINGSPLTGRQRTEDEKIKISTTLQSRWDNLSDKEKEREIKKKSDVAKEMWREKTKEEKQESLNKMHVGNRKNANSGSKNENNVAEMLINYGFEIKQRTKDYTPGRRFEIDICIPKERIAIEWDGPNHFLPIYGEEKLAKVIAKDNIKNKYLTSSGWTIIRIRDTSTTPTLAVARRASDKIIEFIESGKRGVLHIIDT